MTGEPESWSTADEALTAEIDRVEVQVQRARELGWSDVAEAFEQLRSELIDQTANREAGR